MAEARIDVAGDPSGGAGGDAQLRRFVLERHPVRGFWTRLDAAWRELHGFQHYPPAVQALLGEAVTASVLLAATLKFDGTLSLQLQGNGAVRLLVAQCTHDLRIRAVARMEPGAAVSAGVEAGGAAAGFRELVGRGGRMAVTVEAEERAARYQGIVALEGESLAACLEHYFATSEQLPTRIALAAWEDLQAGVASLPGPLLRSGQAEQVLQRVCGEHEARLFAPAPVRFGCRCNPGRVAGLLRALGTQEVRALLAEQGAVTVTCEFCGRPYRFDAVDAERVLADGAQPAGPQSVN
ncbi:MAG TPA: Hsp33 family molecular chaperone HslO [Steroidobacteraceae bacterium]|nr:Hsp33 family molecular chaperone HslO [Steroidobacteraceae bacterium]